MNREIYRYTPASNSWLFVANAPHRVGGAVACVVGDRLFFGTGKDHTGALLKKFYEVDLTGLPTFTFVERAELPYVMSNGCIFHANGRLYLVSGKEPWSGV